MPADNRSRSQCASWALLALFIVQFALLFSPEALAWDGAFYYATARSIFFDHDLDLGNDLILSYDVTPSPDFAAERFDQTLTPTGRVASPFAIGASLLWLPWFTLIYVVIRLASLFGLGPSTLTGYEWPFVWGSAVVTATYGWLAVLVGFRWARTLVGDRVALVASATVMFVTPLLYYQFREPFYAHAASALTTALFVAAWWRSSQRQTTRFPWPFALGALGGLAALVRTQNITYLILPALTALSTGWSAARERDWSAVRRTLGNLLLVGLGTLTLLTIQFSVWAILYGQPLTIPQGATFIDWRAPWMGQVLLSTFHGLLIWVPIVLPAIIGLLILARRGERRMLALLLAVALQVYVNGCARDWFGGGGYGARRFSSTLFILLIGYAGMLSWRSKGAYRALAAGLSVALVVHQWLILRYGFGDQIGGRVISMEPSFSWQADGLARFGRQLVGYIPRIAQDLLDVFRFPDSPLGVSSATPYSTAGQFALLAGVLGITWWLWRTARRLASFPIRLPVVRRLLSCALVVGVIMLDVWLLSQA